MGKVSGIAWTALAAEVVLFGIKFIAEANSSVINLGVIPITVAVVALVSIVIVATEW